MRPLDQPLCKMRPHRCPAQLQINELHLSIVNLHRPADAQKLSDKLLACLPYKGEVDNKDGYRQRRNGVWMRMKRISILHYSLGFTQ